MAQLKSEKYKGHKIDFIDQSIGNYKDIRVTIQHPNSNIIGTNGVSYKSKQEAFDNVKNIIDNEQSKKFIYGYLKKGNTFERHKLDNIFEELSNNRVTYRGLGMGKKSSDFYKFANDSGWNIVYKGKEYYITEKDFDMLKEKGNMRFKAPYRRMS